MPVHRRLGLFGRDVCVREDPPDGGSIDASLIDASGARVVWLMERPRTDRRSRAMRDREHRGVALRLSSAPARTAGVLESGTGDGLDLACGRTGRVEHVYAVDLASPSDLFINATSDHVYSIRTNCNDAASAIACSAFSQTFRGLEAGRYYLIFESDVSTPVEPYGL